MPRQLSCRGMCRIVTRSDCLFFMYEQHVFIQNLAYELTDPLWNESLDYVCPEENT